LRLSDALYTANYCTGEGDKGYRDTTNGKIVNGMRQCIALIYRRADDSGTISESD